MWRTVAVVAWAIGLSNPSLSSGARAKYAKVVRTIAGQRKIDPFTIVSMVHNESRWRSGVVSRDGEDLGLGQIRARYIGACRKDRDPVRNPSRACRAVKARLLTPIYNLRLVGAAITAWRKLCKKKVGRALFQDWLHGYGGMGRPPGILCGHRRTPKGWRPLRVHPILRRIMDRRRMLIRRQPRR